MNRSGPNTSTHRDSPPRLVRLGRALREAILGTMAYVARATGTEPTQDEIAAVLRSYFTLNEVTNQISYLRKRPREADERQVPTALDRLSFRFNLVLPPSRNMLARAGFFIRPIAESLVLLRRHAASALGSAPSDGEVARSLTSTFILSELKNQIVHARTKRSAPPL